jgi:hypothetical protein
MVAIYRGEDTDFAGAEPIQIKIDTDLDLTGYTAELLFGSVVKEYGAEDVGKKILPLSFTAEETSGFFPGRGYATVKVYDTQGRVAILKRFVIDVRFRRVDRIDAIDFAESFQTFENVKVVAAKLAILSLDDDMAKVKDTINELLMAARARVEFVPVTDFQFTQFTRKDALLFVECMRNLQCLSLNIGSLNEDADTTEVKAAVNSIIAILGNLGGDAIKGVDFTKVQDPSSSVNSIMEWAITLNKLLKKVTE